MLLLKWSRRSPVCPGPRFERCADRSRTSRYRSSLVSLLVSVATVPGRSPALPNRWTDAATSPADVQRHWLADLESGLISESNTDSCGGHSRATSTGHRGSTAVTPDSASARGWTFVDGSALTSKLVMPAPGVPPFNPHRPTTPTAYQRARTALTASASGNQQQPSTTGLSRNA
jgi:hypothetical protein